MSTLTKPQARIPLGWVMVAGRRMPVMIDLEYDRYLSVLTDRAGGVSGDSTTDLSASAFDDAGTEELEAAIYAVNDAWQKQPPAIAPIEPVPDLLADLAALRAEVDTLRQVVQGLMQSTAI